MDSNKLKRSFVSDFTNKSNRLVKKVRVDSNDFDEDLLLNDDKTDEYCSQVFDTLISTNKTSKPSATFIAPVGNRIKSVNSTNSSVKSRGNKFFKHLNTSQNSNSGIVSAKSCHSNISHNVEPKSTLNQSRSTLSPNQSRQTSNHLQSNSNHLPTKSTINSSATKLNTNSVSKQNGVKHSFSNRNSSFSPSYTIQHSQPEHTAFVSEVSLSICNTSNSFSTIQPKNKAFLNSQSSQYRLSKKEKIEQFTTKMNHIKDVFKSLSFYVNNENQNDENKKEDDAKKNSEKGDESEPTFNISKFYHKQSNLKRKLPQKRYFTSNLLFLKSYFDYYVQSEDV